VTIKVIPLGILREHINGKKEMDLPVGRTIAEIIQLLKIPNELVAGVFVNEKSQPKDYLPQDGDIVKLIAIIGGGSSQD
jgi:sulfur carrier protein ThiS